MVKKMLARDGSEMSYKDFTTQRAVNDAHWLGNGIFAHAQFTDTYTEGLLYVELLRRHCIMAREAILNSYEYPEMRDKLEDHIVKLADQITSGAKTEFMGNTTEFDATRFKDNGN